MVFRPSLTEEQVPSGCLKGEGKRKNLKEGALYSRGGLGQFLSARIFFRGKGVSDFFPRFVPCV